MGLLNIASNVGSFLGTHGTGIGSALTGIAGIGSLFGGSSGGTNVASSMALMRYQNELQKDYTQWLNENQYSQLRKGLEDANYNPLLALGATPQQGSTGIANVTNPESKTAQLMEVMAGLAQIDNLKANTANTQAGVVGKILGSGTLNKIKKFFGRDQSSINKDVKETVKNGLGLIKGMISNSAKAIYEDGKSTGMLLRGYISNTASNGRFTERPDLDELGRLPKELAKYHRR